MKSEAERMPRGKKKASHFQSRGGVEVHVHPGKDHYFNRTVLDSHKLRWKVLPDSDGKFYQIFENKEFTF